MLHLVEFIHQQLRLWHRNPPMRAVQALNVTMINSLQKPVALFTEACGSYSSLWHNQ